jgi:hypothetical protein
VLEDRLERPPWRARWIENIGESLQETLRSAAMNERIRAIQVAKRPLKPKRSGLEDKPLMLLSVARFDRQPQLERHVESWRAVTELDPREVMKRKPTPAQQLPDSFEAALWTGNLDN